MDLLTGYLQGAAVGLIEGAHDLQQGGFAGSAGTDDADYFVGHDVEVDAFEHFEAVEGFAYIAYRYNGLYGGLHSGL